MGEDGGIQDLSKQQSQNLYGEDEGSIQRHGVTGCRLQEEDKEFRGRTKANEQVKVSEQQQRVRDGTGPEPEPEPRKGSSVEGWQLQNKAE